MSDQPRSLSDLIGAVADGTLDLDSLLRDALTETYGLEAEAPIPA